MHSSYPIAKTKVKSWKPHTPGSIQDKEEELVDVGWSVEIRNASEYYLLLVDASNVKRLIPPRPRLAAKNSNIDAPVGQLICRRLSVVRNPVKIYVDDVSHVDSDMSKKDVVGSIKEFVDWKNRGHYGLDRGGQTGSFNRRGEATRRRFDEDDYVDTMSESFALDVDELAYDTPVYLMSADCVVVKLSSEPIRDDLLKYNHPICLGRIRRKSLRPLGTEIEIQYTWRPPSHEASQSLWINVSGHPVEIKPTAGSVGAPGLSITIGDNQPLFITPEQLAKDTTAYGVFLTADAAMYWQAPVQRDAIKLKNDTEKQHRLNEATVLTEMQAQLKYYRDELDRQTKEATDENKRQRDNYLAELKLRDDEAKRLREQEAAERQRKIEIWKYAAAMTATAISVGLTLIKLVEKIAGKK